MSFQKQLLLQVAAALNSNDLDHVDQWFTADFELHEPGRPEWPVGHEGARRMLTEIRGKLPGVKVEALDMLEEGDRVAVRWLFSATLEGGTPAPFRRGNLPLHRGPHLRGLGDGHPRALALRSAGDAVRKNVQRVYLLPPHFGCRCPIWFRSCSSPNEGINWPLVRLGSDFNSGFGSPGTGICVGWFLRRQASHTAPPATVASAHSRRHRPICVGRTSRHLWRPARPRLRVALPP